MGCFGRWAQRQREKRGKETTHTVYPVEFEEKVRLIESVRMNTMNLVKAIDQHLEVYGKLKGPATNRSDMLGGVALAYGPTLSTSHPNLSNCLDEWGKAEKSIGTLEQNYQRQVKSEVVAPLLVWLTKEYSVFKKQNKLLRKRRLDMDAAAHKVRINPDDQKLAGKAERAKKIHYEIMEKFTVEQLNNTSSVLTSHQKLYERFITIRRDFLTACASALTIITSRALGRLDTPPEIIQPQDSPQPGSAPYPGTPSHQQTTIPFSNPKAQPLTETTTPTPSTPPDPTDTLTASDTPPKPQDDDAAPKPPHKKKGRKKKGQKKKVQEKKGQEKKGQEKKPSNRSEYL